MKTLAAVAAFLVFASASPSAEGGKTAATVKEVAAADIGNACGANAAWLMLKMNGRDADYSTILRELGLDSIVNDGASIGDVIGILKKNGLKCSALKIRTADFFAKTGRIFVVYEHAPEGEKLGHFYVVRSIAPDMIQVVDPPNSIRTFNSRELDESEYIAMSPVSSLTMRERIPAALAVGLLLFAGGLTAIVFTKWKKRG